MQGTVTSFVHEKKFGFIKGDDGKDYFFHQNSFQKANAANLMLDGALVEFVPTATPKGYRAERCSFVDHSGVETCQLPDTVLFSKTLDLSGWELIEVSDWIVHGSSGDSPDAARLALAQAALQLGASAVLQVEYYKTRGSLPGTGKGTYHFTVHNFRGRLALAARRRAEGSYHLADFRGLDQRASSEKTRLIEMSRKSRRRASIAWPLVSLTTFLGFLGIVGADFNWLIAGYATIAALIMGLIFAGSDEYDRWLEHSPLDRQVEV